MAHCFDFISVNATGLQVTTGAASAVAAIPTTANGKTARFVRLQALATCYVRPSGAGGTATVNDVLLTPNEHVILCVDGFTHLAHIQEAAAAKFNITPLES